MTRMRQRHLLRISLPWLLWLAALLPLAQTAAAWHELTHAVARLAGQSPAPDNDPKAVHATACALCLASAAVQTGGLASAAPQVPHTTLSQWLPAPAGTPASGAAPLLGYRSRAPPPAG